MHNAGNVTVRSNLRSLADFSYAHPSILGEHRGEMSPASVDPYGGDMEESGLYCMFSARKMENCEATRNTKITDPPESRRGRPSHHHLNSRR